jgi:hypothetical protein
MSSTRGLGRLAALTVLAAAGVMLASGTAIAAPGDSYPTDQATPDPTQPPRPTSPYPLFSHCYELTPAAPTLGRRECFLYDSATGTLVPDSGQTSVYPKNTALAAPVIPATAPLPAYNPPALSEPIPQVPAQAWPGPVKPLPHATVAPEVLAAGPSVTANGKPIAQRNDAACVPNAVRGMRGYDVNLDPDNNGVSCETPTSSDASATDAPAPQGIDKTMVAAYIVIGIAATVLAYCLFTPVRRAYLARHRA